MSRASARDFLLFRKSLCFVTGNQVARQGWQVVRYVLAAVVSLRLLGVQGTGMSNVQGPVDSRTDRSACGSVYVSAREHAECFAGIARCFLLHERHAYSRTALALVNGQPYVCQQDLTLEMLLAGQSESHGPGWLWTACSSLPGARVLPTTCALPWSECYSPVKAQVTTLAGLGRRTLAASPSGHGPPPYVHAPP